MDENKNPGAMAGAGLVLDLLYVPESALQIVDYLCAVDNIEAGVFFILDHKW
jgi:hypothetical protein